MAARRAQQRTVDPRVLLVGGQLLQRIQSMEHKPRMTLALMAVNVAVWVLPGLLGGGSPALCPSRQVAGFDPPAWAVAWNVVHADDGGWHLYYNMASLLAKGALLESSLGGEQLAALVVLLALGTSFLYMVLAYTLTVVLGVASTYHGCVVGFSGVLFGMSVVLNHSPLVAPRQPMPALLRPLFPAQDTIDVQHVIWAELVLGSLMQRNVSLVGHLAGLLSGLVYVKGGALRPLVQSWWSRGAAAWLRTTPSRGWQQAPARPQQAAEGRASEGAATAAAKFSAGDTGKKTVLVVRFTYKCSFCQDRLGTNIRENSKRSTVLLQWN